MRISSEEAKALVHSGGEVAFLDVREAADYGDGHPLFAVPCPYSLVEAETRRLVPNTAVPLLLIDNSDGISDLAAVNLLACGYRNVRVIEGGIAAWRAAGYGLFAGVNVPSKTLGELLEHDHHPETLDPQTLNSWKSDGKPFHFFDARPAAEYGKMRIPGARCLPNGELAHRLGAVIADETTPIVITCAGRTRGIVGALGLRALGVRNPVFALKNGTQGWALADLALERGAIADPYPELDDEAHALSRRRAERLQTAGVSFISLAEAARLHAQSDRTTYLFDMRTQAERARLPCPSAIPVLGGQLVQATDQYVGVRHSRLILVDDTGLRGGLAALWLAGLGYEVHVAVPDGQKSLPLFKSPHAAPCLTAMPERIPVAQAIDAMKHAATTLFDLRPSGDFEKGHLRGARWSIRPDFCENVPAGTDVALLFGDRNAVSGIASDLSGCGLRVFWLDARLEECAAAGWPLERSSPMNRSKAIDRVWFVHDRHDGNREASLRYLAWETGLIEQLDAQERAEFLSIRLPG